MPNEAKQIIYDDEYMQGLEGEGEAIDTEFDPDADFNRPAPPIHDGWYYGKASNAGVYLKGGTAPVPFREAQWKNETKPHYEVAVKVEIVSDDPLVNGKHVYTNMALTTTPDPERNNASPISGAYRAMAGQPITGIDKKAHAKQLVELLKSEPMVKVRVQACLRDQDAEKAYNEKKNAGTLTDADKNPKAVYGEKKIMQLPGGMIDSGRDKGKFSGAADHPVTGGRCVARAYIVEFKSASDPQETR